MGALSSLRDFAGAAARRFARACRRAETRRALDRLPPHILKDIGYGKRYFDIDTDNTV